MMMTSDGRASVCRRGRSSETVEAEALPVFSGTECVRADGEGASTGAADGGMGGVVAEAVFSC